MPMLRSQDGLVTPVIPSVAKHSPIMRGLALEMLKVVGQGLQQCPTDGELWKCWENLDDLAGPFPICSVLDRVALSPHQDPGFCPPSFMLRDRCVRTLRKSGEWEALRAFLGIRWKKDLSDTGDPSMDKFVVAEGFALLEAHLRLKDAAAAEVVFGEWTDRIPLNVQRRAQAVQLAREVGLKPLAEKWSTWPTRESRW